MQRTAPGNIEKSVEKESRKEHSEFAKDSATIAVWVVVPTVAESVGDGEARPPEFEKHSTTTESNVAVSSGEAGPSWPKASGRNRAATASAGKARPPGIAKQSATTKPELVKASDEAGSPWSSTGVTNCAVAADAMLLKPPGCAHSATTESASSGSRAGGTTCTAEAADAKSVAEARPRGIEKLGVCLSAWTRANALVEGTREVWSWGDSTETSLTVESGRCR